MRLSIWSALASLATAINPAASRAAADHGSPAAAVAGWEGLVEGVRDLPGQILAKLPPEMREDRQIQQEVGRLALAAIATASLQALGSDGDHPAFLPGLNLVLNAGQPNADTIYRTARITAGGSYRLRGVRGSARLVILSQAGPPPGTPGAGTARGPRPHHDFDSLTLDEAGRFDVLLSPERPAGHQGDWWPLDPTTANLILRVVSSDWSQERDPTIAIERLDGPATRPRPSAAQVEQQLRQLPAAAHALGTLLVDYVEQLRRDGYLHRFKGRAPREGGLTGQFYYESAYELGEDEALIVEVEPPSQCRYRSLMLINEIEQAIDWVDNHSSLNDAQAKVDADGMLRIVVAAQDPGVANWLDTAGHRKGMIQGRWTECNAQPVPSIRKVALRDVRNALPKDTPQVTPGQREQIIRERRAAFQQRPLW